MRSVVLKPIPRCGRCRLPPRWCVCAGHREVRCPLGVDVLVHHRERRRPSSTGQLIQRVLPDSRSHEWHHERPLAREDVRQPGRELWLLHPHGEPAPSDVRPESVQVVLLDGSWSEATAMAKVTGAWGRLVSLPMTGVSRYWLRDQQDGGRFSTVEALIFVLEHFGLGADAETLRLQLELHVYANLRARGRKAAAEDFLRDSPLPAQMPELLAQLNVRRPREP